MKFQIPNFKFEFPTFLTRHRRAVLCFHGISAHKHPGLPLGVQPYLDRHDLRAILGWLQARFTFLTPAQWLDANQPGLLLTFDDGFANNLEHALPELEAFNAPAVFFIATQHVANPRDWLHFVRTTARSQWGTETQVPPDLAHEFFDGLSVDQLTDLARHPLASIGAHTVTHPLLPECTPDQLTWELTTARQSLQTWTNRPVDWLAYPAGQYTPAVAAAARQAGYTTAFTLRRASPTPGVPTPEYSAVPAAFAIPRIDLYQADPTYLSLKLSGLHHRPAWQITHPKL